MKSSALTGSPLETLTSWRILNVYVRPSAEMSAGPDAMSGISFRLSSNLYRPENTLRKMSMSTAADMWAGSRSPTSSTIGKLSVWSAARFSVVPPPPGPQAAATHNAPNATARERNLEYRLIQPPHRTRSEAAHQTPSHPPPSLPPLPAEPGRECAGDA